ncbi:MAG TPA: trypsin-like peptidase domain-containing protein [Acetobacteraceae bacterium]|nr:trypsin-like peptidase domain-containing protein [Acetobacteraceae bacterium]
MHRVSPRLIQIALVWLLLLATLWVIEPYAIAWRWAARAPRPVTPRARLSAYEQATIDVYRRASPSVVHVYATGEPVFLGGDRQTLQTGSGVIWDRAGDIVTNNHVIRGQSQFGLRLTTGQFATAHLVGTAPNYDLAVLRIDRARMPLQPILVGSSKDLVVGQSVFAIGNPYGLDQTLSNGIISALHGRLQESNAVEIADMIQTDAPINPGNSGGPLIDSAGRMIGLNTAILSRSGGFAGIGFAIPIDTVNRIAADIIRTGHAPVPGIGIVTASPAASAQLGVQGVIIIRVIPDSSAAKAGLVGVDPETGMVGDIVVAVDGNAVSTVADLSAAFTRAGIGHTVTLTVDRNGATRQVKVAIADIAGEGGAP